LNKEDEERIKQLAKVVCICKGINLGRVLKGMDGCETVVDVNRKVGTGSGGCAGERCGPRIRLLLRKKKEAAEAKRQRQQAAGQEDEQAPRREDEES
jgi:hypothetical protein